MKMNSLQFVHWMEGIDRIGILEETFSEAALITYRVKVEILWFRRLASNRLEI